MIKLIILDVDGVMTNGKKTYNWDGYAISKEFCDKDWTAIKRFKALGVNVVFLSGDKFNKKIAQNRNITFWHNELPKETYLNSICLHLNVMPEEVAYAGDDLFDVEISKLVGYKYCPADAVIEMKDICTIIGANGGDNFVMHLFNHLYLRSLIPRWTDSHVKIMYELDNKEVKSV